MTTSGMFTCEADFCSSCTLSGSCDQTCSLCGGSEDEGGHRRVQLDADCDPQYFIAASTNVTRDCCDGPSGCDSTGVPTTCDAKCAIRFVQFYDRCSHVMLAFDPSTMPAFRQLYATCSSLPTEVRVTNRMGILSAILTNILCDAGVVASCSRLLLPPAAAAVFWFCVRFES